MSVAAHRAVHNTLSASRTEFFNRWQVAMQATETQMILVVGDDPQLMEFAALSLFRAGHIPVLGQWFWPLVNSDSASINAAFDDLADPVGTRLLGRCDAILCLEPTPGAGALLAMAHARGLRVYDNLEDALSS